jgi:hypothetical protein
VWYPVNDTEQCGRGRHLALGTDRAAIDRPREVPERPCRAQAGGTLPPDPDHGELAWGPCDIVAGDPDQLQPVRPIRLNDHQRRHAIGRLRGGAEVGAVGASEADVRAQHSLPPDPLGACGDLKRAPPPGWKARDHLAGLGDHAVSILRTLPLVPNDQRAARRTGALDGVRHVVARDRRRRKGDQRGQ